MKQSRAVEGGGDNFSRSETNRSGTQGSIKVARKKAERTAKSKRQADEKIYMPTPSHP
jgi:hypothetical protein